MRFCCRNAVVSAFTAVSLIAVSFAAGAQTVYPNKPVKLIITWPVGGSADVIGRQLASVLGVGLGQTVFVENMVGASGNIGNGAFVRSPADGYTLLLATSTTNSAGTNLFSKLPFHPVDDFAPIALAAQVPGVLVVRAQSPFKSYRDVVDAAKARPGSLSYGSGGTGNSAHLSAALFAKELGINMLHVPYKGNAPAFTDLLGGQIDFMFDNSPMAMIEAGKVRALGVIGEQRSPMLPEVPTFKELGHPGIVLITWFGLAAPKGTPAVVIDKVHAALVDGFSKTDAATRLESLGFQLKVQPPRRICRLLEGANRALPRVGQHQRCEAAMRWRCQTPAPQWRLWFEARNRYAGQTWAGMMLG